MEWCCDQIAFTKRSAIAYLQAIIKNSPNCKLNNDDFVWLLRSNLSRISQMYNYIGLDYNLTL